MEKVKFERDLEKENEVFENFCEAYRKSRRDGIELISESDIIREMLREISAEDARACGYDIPDKRHIDGKWYPDFSLYVDMNGTLEFGSYEKMESISDVIPKFPKVEKILKKSPKYIKYCRKMAQEFLDATSDVSCDDVTIDYLELGIKAAESNLGQNARQFYKDWNLYPLVLSYMKENNLSYEHSLEAIYRILTMVEMYLIRVRVSWYEDINSVEQLSKALSLPELKNDNIEDFDMLRLRFVKKGSNPLHEVNCKLASAKAMKERAKSKTYEKLQYLDDETVKIYMMLPREAQEEFESRLYEHEDDAWYYLQGYMQGVMQVLLDNLYDERYDKSWNEDIKTPFVKRFREEVKKSKFDELYANGGALAKDSDGGEVLYECAMRAM